MPNDCQNILCLLDKPEDTHKVLKKYMSKNEEGDLFFDFNKVIKMPKALDVTSCTPDPKTAEGKQLLETYEKNKDKYGFTNWYDWCIANWGTKWNSYGNYQGDESLSFETAWAPPIPVITKLAEKSGKDWVLYYSEQGMDFCGKLTAHKTGLENHEEWNSHKAASKEFKDFMGFSEEDFMSEEELEALENKRKKKAKVKKKVKKEIKKNRDEQLEDLESL